jgi:hypothetical protein
MKWICLLLQAWYYASFSHCNRLNGRSCTCLARYEGNERQSVILKRPCEKYPDRLYQRKQFAAINDEAETILLILLRLFERLNLVKDDYEDVVIAGSPFCHE